MARKSTPRAGTEATGGTVMDRPSVGASIPPTPSEARPGSAVSLEMVNVFGEPSAESIGSAPGARLQLTAWVNNVSYLKDVWVDAYLTDAAGAVAHRETLVLDYREGAGGGGDFFVLDAAIAPPTVGRASATPVTSLQYRLYYQIGDTVFAEGVLHELALGTPAGTAPQQLPPTLTARATSKVVADGEPAAPKRGAKAAAKKATATPNGSGDAEAPPKRTLRRRPTA